MNRGIKAAWLAVALAGCGAQAAEPRAPYSTASGGELDATFRGNGGGAISGIGALTYRPNGVGAFGDADIDGGLNYEHLLCGSPDPRNWMSPRSGAFPIAPRANGATLTRAAADDPWGVAATASYSLAGPHHVDFEFRATLGDASRFRERGFAAFFFASYMFASDGDEIRFRGYSGPGAPESWVDSTPAFPGNHFAPLGSADLAGDRTDRAVELCVGQERWPRIARPFYLGRCRGGMCWSVHLETTDEVRFTVMRWHPGAPAWDFQVVVRDPPDGREVLLRGRASWRPFESDDAVLADDAAWRAGLPR